MENLEDRVKKLENDRKITGSLLGLLVIAVIYLLFF